MITEQQRLEALAICDRILESRERAHKNLSEGLAGLIKAIDDIKAQCGIPSAGIKTGDRNG